LMVAGAGRGWCRKGAPDSTGLDSIARERTAWIR
jgi:hypothetical protein